MSKKRLDVRALEAAVERGISRTVGMIQATDIADEPLKKMFPERLVMPGRGDLTHCILAKVAIMPAGSWEAPGGVKMPKENEYGVYSYRFAVSSGQVRVVPSGLAFKMDQIDEKLKELHAQQKKLVKQAYKDGKPLAWEKAIEVVEMRKKLRKRAGLEVA